MLKHYLGEAPMFAITLDNHRAAAADDIAAACNSLPSASAQALPQGPQALAQAFDEQFAVDVGGRGHAEAVLWEWDGSVRCNLVVPQAVCPQGWSWYLPAV